jgi:hypothetical protein
MSTLPAAAFLTGRKSVFSIWLQQMVRLLFHCGYDIMSHNMRQIAEQPMRTGRPAKHRKISEAQAAFKRGEIPADAYAAFKAQVHNAYQRDIPFLFTIHEWWS